MARRIVALETALQKIPEIAEGLLVVETTSGYEDLLIREIDRIKSIVRDAVEKGM